MVTFESMPASAPAANRLRSLLKHALRACRLRCVEVRAVAADATEDGGGGPAGPAGDGPPAAR